MFEADRRRCLRCRRVGRGVSWRGARDGSDGRGTVVAWWWRGRSRGGRGGRERQRASAGATSGASPIDVDRRESIGATSTGAASVGAKLTVGAGPATGILGAVDDRSSPPSPRRRPRLARHRRVPVPSRAGSGSGRRSCDRRPCRHRRCAPRSPATPSDRPAARRRCPTACRPAPRCTTLPRCPRRDLCLVPAPAGWVEIQRPRGSCSVQPTST
jgi:hypothetical protein